MSPTLSHEEHLELLACIGELHRCRSLAAFPEHAAHALARLIPCSFAAFNEVNLPRGRLVAVSNRPIPDHDRMMANFERYSAQHPLLRYAVESGDGQAVKISDFLSEDDYHALELYQSMYRMLEAEDQFSIVVRSDVGIMIACAFNRGQRDFTERDRLKLNLVRPHLLQAYANVEELAGHLEEKRDLETALRETGHGVIGLDANGRVAHATPGVADCLARYFPVSEPLGVLPIPVLEWLRVDGATPFVAAGTESKLIIRKPANTERPLLLLSEEHHGRLPSGQHLTPREVEVLHWLAEGKSNAEIATILGIASGTAKQHVERILAKLGVENRTAAAALVRERGLGRMT